MTGRLLASLLLASLPGLAQAQSGKPISPEAFLLRAEGRTLTFTALFGGEVGRERFMSRTSSVWTEPDGTCGYGTIWIDGPLLCFNYDFDPTRDHCWLTFSDNGRLRVESVPGGSTQIITNIDTQPLGCEGEPLS